MHPQSALHDWARRLIASEVNADPTSAGTELATLRVYEKLRRQLCAPIGVDGFQAVAVLALALAKSQSPRLNGVHLLPNGGWSGLTEVKGQKDTKADELGIILIAQLLGLFLTLLGETATVRLIDGVSVEIKPKEDAGPKEKKLSQTVTNNFPPFDDISLEADRLRQVSERLETLAELYADVDELTIVAGNIRSIATVLEVFLLVRSKADGSKDTSHLPSTRGYLN